MLNRFLGLFLAFLIILAGFWVGMDSAFAKGNQSNQGIDRVARLFGFGRDSASAKENQSDQGIDRVATLIAPSADFKINLYPKPDTKLKRLGYGLRGDEVTILEQMANNQESSWYRVRFANSSAIEGWIKGENIAFVNDEGSEVPLESSDRYLGGQNRSITKQNNKGQNSQGNQHNQRQYNQDSQGQYKGNN